SNPHSSRSQYSDLHQNLPFVVYLLHGRCIEQKNCYLCKSLSICFATFEKSFTPAAPRATSISPSSKAKISAAVARWSPEKLNWPSFNPCCNTPVKKPSFFFRKSCTSAADAVPNDASSAPNIPMGQARSCFPS